MARILKAPKVEVQADALTVRSWVGGEQFADEALAEGHGGDPSQTTDLEAPAAHDPVTRARRQAEEILAVSREEAAQLRESAEETMERAAAVEARAAATAAGAETAAARLADARLAEAEKEIEAARAAVEAEGRRVGEEAVRAELTTHLDTAFQVAEAAQTERQQILVEAEPAIVRLAVDIARRVIAREVTLHSEVLGALAERALQRAAGPSPVRLRMHPEDIELLGPYIEDLERRYAHRNIEIAFDVQVGRGGCVVDTRSGSVDASLDMQITNIEEALLDVTVHEETAEEGP